VFKAYTTAQAGLAGGAGGGPAASPGTGLGPGPGGWHPTVLYMLGLVVAETVAVGWLTRHLLR
jgi:hypothetical protein